eukprot:5438178-Amphidinium_carterae.1
MGPPLVESSCINHPSFYDTHGEEVAPGEAQILSMAQKGFLDVFSSLEVAEGQVGPLVLSPLGNLRKTRHGRVKDRLISDVRGVNRLAGQGERVVLPSPLDHCRALASMLDRWGS